MRYRIWDPGALQAYMAAGITSAQRVFLEGLLRSLEEGTHLSEHVASTPSFLLSLLRAGHALEGNARDGQPKASWTCTVLSQSAVSAARATAAYSVTPTGAAAIAQAQQVLSGASRALRGNYSRTAARQFALQVNSLTQPTEHAIRTLFDVIWNEATSIPLEVAIRIRDEVATMVALHGRDGLALQVDLLRCLNRGGVNALAVSDLLWPAEKQYRIATVVIGTRKLEGIEHLLPGSRQWPLGAPVRSEGMPIIEVRGLLDSASVTAKSSVLIVQPALAADGITAVVRARRGIVEALDQYAAGQRLGRLDISAESVVMAEREKSIMVSPVVGGTKATRPLTDHWPLPLRPALRTANLAGRMDAPVAGVMLAWSALESMGLEPRNIEAVAKACSLHVIRQQILAVYKGVTEAANARIRYEEWAARNAGVALRRAENAFTRVSAQSAPAAKARAAEIRDQLAELRLSKDLAETSVVNLNGQLRPSIAIVQSNLLNGRDSTHPLDTSSWTLDLDKFCDVLLLSPEFSSPPWVQQTQGAIDVLAREAGGLPEAQLAVWRARLADPSSLARWLTEQQGVYHELLNWMYITRNQAIHSGEFMITADAMTAMAASRIVDMVLEFLGHWYRDQNKRNQVDDLPSSIIRDLANRSDALLAHLHRATSCRPLNVTTITALGADCWNRQ